MHQARREHSGAPFKIVQMGDEGAHRRFGGALQAELGDGPQGSRRPRTSRRHRFKDRKQLLDTFAIIDVGVFLHPDQDRAAFDHRGRDVAVQVEDRAHRHARSDRLADRAQDHGLAVVDPLGDHRTVQIEHDHVDGPAPAQAGQNLAQQGLEQRRADRPRGLRPEAGALDQMMAPRKGGGGGVAVARKHQGRGARRLVAGPIAEIGLEAAQAGGKRREAVGLVREARQIDAEGRI